MTVLRFLVEEYVPYMQLADEWLVILTVNRLVLLGRYYYPESVHLGNELAIHSIDFWVRGSLTQLIEQSTNQSISNSIIESFAQLVS
jgi:hypothetical protein